mmetsp:Transcript_6349/g.12615  ORF Transcript_6349/g.12615 Transcript_6349/m.12615 type:complete len:140 (-) Transcript_6349:102-521(-)
MASAASVLNSPHPASDAWESNSQSTHFLPQIAEKALVQMVTRMISAKVTNTDPRARQTLLSKGSFRSSAIISSNQGGRAKGSAVRPTKGSSKEKFCGVVIFSLQPRSWFSLRTVLHEGTGRNQPVYADPQEDNGTKTTD